MIKKAVSFFDEYSSGDALREFWGFSGRTERENWREGIKIFFGHEWKFPLFWALNKSHSEKWDFKEHQSHTNAVLLTSSQ